MKRDTENTSKFHYEPKVGFIDKTPKFQFAVYSKREGEEGHELESSTASKGQAERFFELYKTWGLPDTTFYLVDWNERKLLDTFKPKKENL